MKITDEMVEAGLAHYSEGGCMGLDEAERREVVVAILEAAALAEQTQQGVGVKDCAGVAGALRVLLEGIKEAEADIAFDADAGNRSDVSEYGVSLPYETALDIARLLLPHATRDHKHGIYIASKTKYADRWRFLRDKVGEPIISTWIDEAGVGESNDLADLWRRCIVEASTAEVLILYREPEDVLKGGWVELGAALASGVTVFAVGIEEFTIAHDKRIRHFPDMKAAIAASRLHLSALVDVPAVESEPVARRPSYQQIKDVVQENVNRMHQAGESHLMMARWLSTDIDKLYPAHPPRSSLIQSEEGEKIAKLTEALRSAADWIGILKGSTGNVVMPSHDERDPRLVEERTNKLISEALSTPPSPYGGDNGDGSATGTNGGGE